MLKALIWLAKAALVFIALMAASMAGGAIFYAGYQPPEAAAEIDPAAMMLASIAVQAANALMLAALAAQSRLSRAGSAALLFALLFFVQTFLSLMELAFFSEFFAFDMQDLPRNAGMGALTALAGAAAAAFLFSGGARAAAFAPRTKGALAWRFALACALYPVAYWLAGYFIVTSNETALAFYGEGFTDRIEPGPLLALQLLRGAIWAGLALAATHGLRGSRLTRAIFVGAAFSVLMVLPLLYPNALMPEAVRMLHFVEIAVSNFLYGVAAAMLLAPARLRA